MAMGTVTGLREAMPELRTFVLTRAGSPGIQRYAANWMGDNQSRWDHLWVSIPMAAGFGLSGQPFVGADVGGFMGYAEAEMFLRWMQYGALTPFCRNHSMMGNVDQYAWSWGETVLGHVRDGDRAALPAPALPLRGFVRAAETGAPVQRPLVFDHQHDAAVRDIDDEYLLGPDLLVAPVLEPGTTARQVYLPAGDWYDWHTGERHARRPLGRRADADGADPALRPRGRGRPDVAARRRRRRRATTRRSSSCTSSRRRPTASGRRCSRRTTGSRSPRSRAPAGARRSRSPARAAR